MKSPNSKKVTAIWLRRDFRLTDQKAFFEATHRSESVYPFFVIDPRTIEEFSSGLKPQAAFFGALLSLRKDLQKEGRDLTLLEGNPEKIVPEFCKKVGACELHFNKDYEPGALSRDEGVEKNCRSYGIEVFRYKDQVLFEENEILNLSGKPYQVFTAYKKASMKLLSKTPPKVLGPVRLSSIAPSHPDESLWRKLEKVVESGRAEASNAIPPAGEKAAHERLRTFIARGLPHYSEGRNLPALKHGTSRLSMDLRSGAISPRQVWQAVRESGAPLKESDIFLSELIWRDFFMMVGFQSPHVYEGNYNSKYNRIRWRNNESEFKAWCEGRTGYPIVDAGMRELLTTGFMHNRVRMIVAMFLVKDLLVDWRKGDLFFREHLVDGDLAVNNGNWQWCASTGVDAQPYFRIFNPASQSKRFDPDGEYIRKHVPEYRKLSRKEIHQPQNPIVSHEDARVRCLIAYRS